MCGRVEKKEANRTHTFKFTGVALPVPLHTALARSLTRLAHSVTEKLRLTAPRFRLGLLAPTVRASSSRSNTSSS